MANKPNSNVHSKSITVAFLGPDGSGKSTIIEGLQKQNLLLKRSDYFHLKPFVAPENAKANVVDDPHAKKEYGFLKSTIKLLVFIIQYNVGWQLNIRKLKSKSSLIIFDRYFDDLLVDHRRYRYGGSKKLAKFIRNFIPRPDLYFILTAEPNIIHSRKKEVPLAELKRQVSVYRELGKGKRYFNIEVDRIPDEIVNEIVEIITKKINEGN